MSSAYFYKNYCKNCGKFLNPVADLKVFCSESCRTMDKLGSIKLDSKRQKAVEIIKEEEISKLGEREKIKRVRKKLAEAKKEYENIGGSIGHNGSLKSQRNETEIMRNKTRRQYDS